METAVDAELCLLCYKQTNKFWVLEIFPELGSLKKAFFLGLELSKVNVYHLTMAFFDEKMAVGESEKSGNLVSIWSQTRKFVGVCWICTYVIINSLTCSRGWNRQHHGLTIHPTQFFFNEFDVNGLGDNIGSKKSAYGLRKKILSLYFWFLFCLTLWIDIQKIQNM